MFENISSNCSVKSVLFQGMKFLLFTGLLIFVIDQYAIDIYTKFQKKSTVFVSRTSEFDDFILPPITICMKNGFKQSGLEKYGMESRYGFIMMGKKLNKTISSVWNTYEEISYLLNRDFEINIYPCKNQSFQLLVGKNNIKCKDGQMIFIEIQEYYTMTSGTCYDIISDIQIPPPAFFSMYLNLNGSLPHEDFPEVCYQYYAFILYLQVIFKALETSKVSLIST